MREAPSIDVTLLAMNAMTGKMENNKKGKKKNNNKKGKKEYERKSEF